MGTNGKPVIYRLFCKHPGRRAARRYRNCPLRRNGGLGR